MVMLSGVLFRWLLNSLILLVIPYLVPGVEVSGYGPALAMALVLGIINAFIRPVLMILSLPITIISLGLFSLVLNGFLFWLASRMVQGYLVVDFTTAFLAALVFSLATMILGSVVK